MKIIYGFIAFGLFALMSCGSSIPLNNRYINTPTRFSATFLKEKKESKISVQGDFNPFLLLARQKEVKLPNTKSGGFGIQGAYAFTNHFMMTLGYLRRNETDYFSDNDITLTKTESNIQYKRNLLDVGLGYFAPLDSRQRVYFSGIAGFTIGSSNSVVHGTPQQTDYYFNTTANKVYLEPGLNFFFNPYFRMAIMPRVSFLHHNNFNTNYTENAIEHVQYDKLYNNTYAFFEPAFGFQAGFKNADWLKLDWGLHFAAASETGNWLSNSNLVPRMFLFSMGFSVYPQRKKN